MKSSAHIGQSNCVALSDVLAAFLEADIGVSGGFRIRCLAGTGGYGVGRRAAAEAAAAAGDQDCEHVRHIRSLAGAYLRLRQRPWTATSF